MVVVSRPIHSLTSVGFEILYHTLWILSTMMSYIRSYMQTNILTNYQYCVRCTFSLSPILHYIAYSATMTKMEYESKFKFTKDTPYLTLIGELWDVLHSVNCSRNSLLIPEVYRISFSRLRLSSHRLRIETGRWSRIPRDRRLCPCGQIQDEEHVLAHCQITQHLRDAHGDRVDFPEILHASGLEDFRLIHEILQSY